MSRDFTPQSLESNPRHPRQDLQSPHASRLRPAPSRDEILPAEQDRIQESAPHQRNSERRSSARRTVLYDRDREYLLDESEIATMRELGKFRVIAVEDLLQHAYRGQSVELERDRQALLRRGLVRQGVFEGPEANPRRLLTLTERGHHLLCRNRLLPEHQASYHGFFKPREANHDADLYRLYQKESSRIQASGGRNLRVMLDFELQRKVNRDIAKFGTEARPEIAARHGLSCVRNKIPIPDLAIEYETRDGELARVHLELVTEHYRPSQVAEKVRAGFSLYTPRGESDHLRRVLDQAELAADILSL
jgi:hypothetical protein